MEYRKLLANDNFLTSDDVLGKDVIDSRGHYIGVVTQLHIDNRDKMIVGISIDGGFLKPNIFIGTSLISNFGVNSVYISHSPASRYLGLIVFDMYAQKIGKVTKVNFGDKHDQIVSFRVSYGLFRYIDIPVDHVTVLSRNIIIKIDKIETEQLYQKQKKERREARKNKLLHRDIPDPVKK